MTVTLDRDHELKGNGYLLGLDGENESEQFIVRVLFADLLDKWAYIEFTTENGPYTTERLAITEGAVVYNIPNGLLQTGYVVVQVVFRDAEGFVWKSFQRQFAVNPSINACCELPPEYPDFIGEAQKLLDSIEVQAERVDGVLETEIARTEAETARQTAESARQTAETERHIAETQRATAESERASAETARQIAETQRADAEEVRRTEFSGWAVNFGELNTYDKRLINLEEAGAGVLFDVQTDTTTAYIKSVPTGALPYARISKVGGMTYKADGALIDTKAKRVGGYAIPEAIQMLDGYGLGIDDTCYNYIDFERKVFVKRVGVVDLGSLQWSPYSTYNGYVSTIPTMKTGSYMDGLCTKYQILKEHSGTGIRVGANNSFIYVEEVTNDYADAVTFKVAMQGELLLYELETPIETDISAYITDNYIKVAESVVFENDNAKAVPSEITFFVKR